MKPISTDTKTVILCRLVMTAVFVSLCYRWTIQTLPYQFLDPPLFSYALELPFRLYKFLHLPDVLVYNNVTSVIFSGLLLITSFLGILFPRKNWLIIIFSILFFLYFLSYDTFVIIHVHPLAMMVWITIPFWPKKADNRLFLLDALRYYAIFIYVVSFIMKLKGGSFFTWENGVNSLKWNLADYLYCFPDTITASIISFSIAHPFYVNMGHTVILLLEGIMVIGFFTKKYDRWLIWIPVIIHLSTYLYSDVFFVEILVLVFLFLDEKQISWIYKKIPLLGK